jgi:hypothetical protein
VGGKELREAPLPRGDAVSFGPPGSPLQGAPGAVPSVTRRLAARRGGLAPIPSTPHGDIVERLVLALRNDFGCLVIIAAFLVIMISAIVFADIITPPASNPFV